MLAFRAAEDGLPRRFDRTVYRVPTTRALQQALDTAGGHTATVERDPHGVTHVLAHAPARSDTARPRTSRRRRSVMTTSAPTIARSAYAQKSGGRRYHRRVAMLLDESVRARLRPAAALFRSLSDPVRLTILRGLVDGEARVVDLTERLGLAQATVSAHLACLRGCGLVDVRAVGRASVYSLAQPGLLDLFAAAEQVLAATGNAVALCPTYGDPQEQR